MAITVKSLCFSFIFVVTFAHLSNVADARRFNVGGNGVWTINPQENYNTWAERNRFQVNDTLYFKYAKGSDSVQQVMKPDFDSCNIKNPIKNFEDGESVFTFDRSGPFYFISGNEDHCKKGQKLIVVVLAIRNHTTVPISPAKPPTMVQPPKSSSPVSPSHAPTMSPTTPSPSPKPLSPTSSPSPTNPPKSSSSPDQAPISPSPFDTTPSSDNFTAPAPSHKNLACGLTVTSVMTTVIAVAFAVFMFV